MMEEIIQRLDQEAEAIRKSVDRLLENCTVGFTAGLDITTKPKPIFAIFHTDCQQVAYIPVVSRSLRVSFRRPYWYGIPESQWCQCMTRHDSATKL